MTIRPTFTRTPRGFWLRWGDHDRCPYLRISASVQPENQAIIGVEVPGWSRQYQSVIIRPLPFVVITVRWRRRQEPTPHDE